MSILTNIRNKFTLNKMGDNHTVANFGVTIGTVVDTDDPLQMGRLRIYCPQFNDDPKKVQHLPWAAYVSPFGGSVRNACHTKGHPHDDETPNTSTGVTQYGFWAIPELGANVLVACVNGDPRKRIWLGCLYEHQEVGGLFHGVYDWGDSEGEPDGPFSAPEPDFDGDDTKNKIQPLYDNLSKAFDGDRKSAEWKTRGADYAGAVNVDIDKKHTNSEISSGESDSWVKGKLGAAGYDWTSFKNLGSYLASKVVGFMSPGLHSISFDDRPFNSRIKLRTTAGHQIILDDTNERIYVNTYEGKSWIEMDRNGNIDVFSDKRISMRAKKDINFSTDESFRVKAKKGIFLYGGHTDSQVSLLESKGVPEDGEIRFHSTKDIHMLTEKSYRHYSELDTKFEINGTYHTIINEDSFTHSLGGIYAMADTEIFHKTPVNELSLTSIGITQATNFNAVISAGLEIVMSSNLGPIIGTGEEFGPLSLSAASSNEDVQSQFGSTPLYGLSIDDVQCDVPPNSPLFKLDISGNINLQSITDTFMKTKSLGFSSGLQKIVDNVDEFADKYNETIKSIQDHLLENEIAALAMQAAGALTSTAAQSAAFIAMLPLIKSPPSLKDLGDQIVGNVIGKFHLPNLGLSSLCIPANPAQITFAYDIASSTVDIDFDIPFALSESTLRGIELGEEFKEALPSDIQFAPWTNRVPDHEPWPRVMKVDKPTEQNTEIDTPKHNVNWLDQYTNDSVQGRRNIGIFEGDEETTRGDFWRR